MVVPSKKSLIVDAYSSNREDYRLNKIGTNKNSTPMNEIKLINKEKRDRINKSVIEVTPLAEYEQEIAKLN